VRELSARLLAALALVAVGLSLPPVDDRLRRLLLIDR